MFENADFKTEIGGPMKMDYDLDMCLILRSLVSRLVLFTKK
jgi:hypothetical protein